MLIIRDTLSGWRVLRDSNGEGAIWTVVCDPENNAINNSYWNYEGRQRGFYFINIYDRI